jgi:hypothetical protein
MATKKPKRWSRAEAAEELFSGGYGRYWGWFVVVTQVLGGGEMEEGIGGGEMEEGIGGGGGVSATTPLEAVLVGRGVGVPSDNS